jgi:hypothetical protein
VDEKSDIIWTSKSRQLLGQPSFFFSNKKKWEDKRESKNTMRVWERVVQSCPPFCCTNIIIGIKNIYFEEEILLKDNYLNNIKSMKTSLQLLIITCFKKLDKCTCFKW